MDWTKLHQHAVSLYDTVSVWCFDHQMETDLIVGLGVAGSLAYLLKRKTRLRRRAHRILWGVRMRRSRNRLAFEKAMIAAAIEDALFEMEFRGDIHKQSAEEWRKSFANYYQMDELLPVKDKQSVKKSIKWRLNHAVHKVKTIIPGGPIAVKVDKTYKPVVEPVGMKKSKYATAA